MGKRTGEAADQGKAKARKKAAKKASVKDLAPQKAADVKGGAVDYFRPKR